MGSAPLARCFLGAGWAAPARQNDSLHAVPDPPIYLRIERLEIKSNGEPGWSADLSAVGEECSGEGRGPFECQAEFPDQLSSQGDLSYSADREATDDAVAG